MSYQIALTFEDGVTRFIECRPNEVVADASYPVSGSTFRWTVGMAHAERASRSACAIPTVQRNVDPLTVRRVGHHLVRTALDEAGDPSSKVSAIW